MVIREVEIRPVDKDEAADGVLAKFSVVVQGGIAIHNVCLKRSPCTGRIYSQMPARPKYAKLPEKKRNELIDIAHPVGHHGRDYLERVLLDCYQRQFEGIPSLYAAPNDHPSEWRRWVGEDLIVNSVSCKDLGNGKAIKGKFSILVENDLAIHDIKLIQTSDKVIIAMPSEKIVHGDDVQKTGNSYAGKLPERKPFTHRDIVHPISNEVRRIIERHVLDCYQRVLESPTLMFIHLKTG